jgi:outer membrane lipoprotein
MNKIMFMMSVALLLQGCTYAISPDLAKQADKNVLFEQLEADPESYKGKLVILGGTIVHTSNTEQGALIEVEQKSLDKWGKPVPTKKSGGRFMVQHTGYLNALVYGPGRDITVAAVVDGVRKSIDNVESAYPVVLSKELKLWPRERQSWNRPQYLDPLYEPYTSPKYY